ncbi:MAG: class I adenylate-forming enzyme family protein [Planctomycetota bacterium]
MSLDLFHKLRHHADHRPDRPALRVLGPAAADHPTVTWRSLYHQTAAAAARLDRTLPPGATIMLVSGNRPALVPAFLAVLATGRTVFPLDASLTAAEVSRLAERTDPRGLLIDPVLAPRFAPLGLPLFDLGPLTTPPLGPGFADAPDPAFAERSQDAWLWLQSSGTTGGPKIVRRSGPSLDAVARNVAQTVGLGLDDQVVAAVPLSHSYGIENGMLAPLWAGAGALHPLPDLAQPGRGFDPRLAVSPGATVLPGVPAMFEMIDRLDLGPGNLRLAYSAGGPLPPELADRLRNRQHLPLGQLYGTTEVGSVAYSPHPDTVGRPMPGVELRILDPQHPDPDRPLPPGRIGHVAVRAPSMFAGYLEPADPPEAPPAFSAGFFLTGDLGQLNADGRLSLTGRLKLLIDVGGVKVNPLEVERALAAYPDIAECVVVPDPVSPTINRVRALITPVDPAATLDERTLRAFLRTRLAPHKIPRAFEFRATLPKSATGKILRQQLLPRASA